MLEVLKLNDEYEYRYQTVNLTKAGATAVAVYPFDFKPENGWDLVVGCNLYESLNGGVGSYKIGLETEGGSTKIQDITHKNDWICSTDVPPANRYKALGITAKSNYKVQLQITTILVSELNADLVFILARRKQL